MASWVFASWNWGRDALSATFQNDLGSTPPVLLLKKYPFSPAFMLWWSNSACRSYQAWETSNTPTEHQESHWYFLSRVKAFFTFLLYSTCSTNSFPDDRSLWADRHLFRLGNSWILAGPPDDFLAPCLKVIWATDKIAFRVQWSLLAWICGSPNTSHSWQ